MVASRRPAILAVVALSAVGVSAQQGSLTDEEVATAIRLGQEGKDLSVRVGTISGRSMSCEVIMQGPLARVSAAAAGAFREYRPFTAANVTSDMKATTYRVRLLTCVRAHVVLQPAGSSGMEGVIQPLRENDESAIFDHLPDGQFQVVVVRADETHRIRVSLKDRTKIESPLLGMPEAPSPVMPLPAPAAIPKPAATSVRLFVQGDGKHITDALGSLQSELAAAGITGTVAQRGEPYDYLIIFGEGQRNAASMTALDTRGNVVAVAVRGAFTEKGAADGAGQELGKKLAALSR